MTNQGLKSPTFGVAVNVNINSQNFVPDSIDSGFHGISGNEGGSSEFLSNPLPLNVKNDLRIVSRLWSDDQEDDIENEFSPVGSKAENAYGYPKFTAVLSKSQKKKIRQQKAKAAKTDLVNTQRRAGPRNFT